jgi:DNA-binding MarR family transcriptional regulator
VAPFSLLTNHARVWLCIAADPRIRIRDIAARTKLTERATQRIISDLSDADYIHRTREGRRNVYAVRTDLAIALPTERDVALGTLLDALLARSGRSGPLPPSRSSTEAAPTGS